MVNNNIYYNSGSVVYNISVLITHLAVLVEPRINKVVISIVQYEVCARMCNGGKTIVSIVEGLKCANGSS